MSKNVNMEEACLMRQGWFWKSLGMKNSSSKVLMMRTGRMLPATPVVRAQVRRTTTSPGTPQGLCAKANKVHRTHQ
jgi:hypothetical protein